MSNYAKVDIGDLTLYRGDCLRIMPCLPNKSVDCDMRFDSKKPTTLAMGGIEPHSFFG